MLSTRLLPRHAFARALLSHQHPAINSFVFRHVHFAHPGWKQANNHQDMSCARPSSTHSSLYATILLAGVRTSNMPRERKADRPLFSCRIPVAKALLSAPTAVGKAVLVQGKNTTAVAHVPRCSSCCDVWTSMCSDNGLRTLVFIVHARQVPVCVSLASCVVSERANAWPTAKGTS